jgi:hypothetical protein
MKTYVIVFVAIFGMSSIASGQTAQRLEPTLNYQQPSVQPFGNQYTGNPNQPDQANQNLGRQPLIGVGQNTQGVGAQTKGYGAQIKGYGAGVNGTKQPQDRCASYPPPADCRQ